MSQSVKQNLLSAFGYLLKPLIRLAIKNGVLFPDLVEVIKRTYVSVAERQLKNSGRSVSAEGISVLANMDLQEVRSVLASAEAAKVSGLSGFDEPVSPVMRVLSAWFTDPNYSGPYGVLRDLPLNTEASFRGKTAGSFTDLVDQYCPGVSAQSLLDELIATNCVQDVGNGYFRAVNRSYIPAPLSANNIRVFAQIIHNLCETLEVNLRAETVRGAGLLLLRTVISDHPITRQDLKNFDEYIRSRGQLLLDDVDNWLSSRGMPTPDEHDAVNTGIGMYHYVVNEDDENELLQGLDPSEKKHEN